MMQKGLHILLIIVLAFGVACVPASAQKSRSGKKSVTTQQSSNKKSGAQTSSKKKNKSSSKNNSGKKKNTGKAVKETLSKEEMTRRHQTAQKEIAETRKQIAENDKSIKKNLADLNRISSEIDLGKKQIGSMTQQIDSLDSQIVQLQGEIDRNTKELERIRENYLRSLKKMRMTKGKTSTLAFIFASENFNQALRRMRYLREFSRWRDKQTKLIDEKVSRLKYESDLLAQSKADKNRVLKSRQSAQNILVSQQSQQQALVSDLRKNGEALNSHLRKKQAEANDLRNRIAAFIAEEQRKAEQKRLEEERSRKEAERQQLQQQETERKRQLAQNSEKEEKVKPTEEKGSKKASEGKKKKENSGTENSTDFATARKRKPRSTSTKEKENVAQNSSNTEKPKQSDVTSISGFESAKGSLPHPVAGAFRITNPFGRHALPDLPDVMYDNPGIDAEVAKGATALAVYEGKVSGIYVLPGYNNVIIVNHGNYYTIYGNISSPSVKVGDRVKQGQGVGKVAVDADDDSHSTLHFEIWRNREKLNPQSWLR